MRNRVRLWLLPVLLLWPSMATAQNKQSHHSLPGEFDSDQAQYLMAQRFQELHQLQDQVRKLLSDPKFVEGLKDKFTASELRGLEEKLLNREGISRDPSWEKLLEHFQQAGARHNLDEQQLNSVLRRLAKGAAPKSPSPDPGARTFNDTRKTSPTPSSPHPEGVVPEPPSSSPPVEPKETSFERFQVKSTQWLLKQLDDFGGDMLQSIAEMRGMDANSSLAEVLRSVPQSDFSGLNINGNPLVPALRDGRLSHYFSNAGDFLRRQSGIWDGVGSLFHKSPLPSLGNISGPSVSMRTGAAPNSDGWLPVFLCLLMLGVLILVFYKRGFGSKSPRESGEGEEWHLGSWPVSPSAVSTRQDVICAFEYLALLCLGPAAAACHHHQLAQRLAEPDNNPGRRQAAELLAWLYEQARYAPAADALSAEQLSDARHALCLLAGVTAA